MSAGQTVAAIAADDTAWLGRWRTLPGHEACESGGRVWVRGPSGPAWTLLPALERYTEDEAGRLTPAGNRVPVRRLPAAPWLPLTEFLRVRLPAAALPAQHIAPVAWSLIPAAEYRPPALLVLPFPAFAHWCIEAPSVRLRGLRFALADDGRVCVRGALLPALPAETWCLHEAIATPAGWALPKGLTPGLVASSLRLSPGELALLHPDATSERLPAEAFLEVSRSTVRASMRESA